MMDLIRRNEWGGQALRGDAQSVAVLPTGGIGMQWSMRNRCGCATQLGAHVTCQSSAMKRGAAAFTQWWRATEMRSRSACALW
jgi:hypothetical protein